MSEFCLKNMLEYRQIIYKRSVIYAIISRLNYFERPYTGIIADIFNETAGEHFYKSYCGNDYLGNLDKISRRLSIFWSLTRSNLFKSIATEINSKIEKNYDNFFLIANYSFTEYIFWHRCETDPEILKYRSQDSVEALTASVLRKKAEETYKKGHFEAAIDGFKQALELTPEDFTILFQLGMYYFFEKADHIKAADCFARCAKHARGISARMESMACCFAALITRLKALHRGDAGLARDALLVCENALKIDPDMLMARYAFLQSLACMCAFENRRDEFAKTAQALFDSEYNFLLQALLDHAFDPALDSLASMAGSRYDRSLETCVQKIEQTSQKIAAIPNKLETNADTAKVFQLQKEFKSIQEYFKKNKTFTDIEEIQKRLEKVRESIDSVMLNNQAQQKFMQFKQYCSAITVEYGKDFGDRMKPYNDALKKRDEINSRLDALIGKYFFRLQAEENPHASAAEDKSSGYKRIPETENAVKSRSAMIIFSSLEAVIALSWLIFGLIGFVNFVMTTVINICLAPAYRALSAEIFYFLTQLQIDELKRELSKIELKLNLSNNMPGEAELSAREKYAKQIAAEFSISHIDARNILESALAGDFEKMESIARTLCRRA